MARVTFVVAFEHFVFLVNKFMSNMIPALPGTLVTQMSRERLASKEHQFRHVKRDIIRQARLESFYDYTCPT